MEKVAISVLGFDRPGIIAAVAGVLFENRCNIEDVDQTILQTEFAGIFIASMPEGTTEEALLRRLQERLVPMGLSVLLRKTGEAGEWNPPASEPFVITTRGPDRLGLVAGVTDIISRFGVNIANLKAVFRGNDDARQNIMIYEVEVPVDIDQKSFRETLHEWAKEFGLDISIQHRDIFEAIHRV
ncbi:MAG: glycine cleavage system protein R [Acidobacteriota bacterium]